MFLRKPAKDFDSLGFINDELIKIIFSNIFEKIERVLIGLDVYQLAFCHLVFQANSLPLYRCAIQVYNLNFYINITVQFNWSLYFQLILSQHFLGLFLISQKNRYGCIEFQFQFFLNWFYVTYRVGHLKNIFSG